MVTTALAALALATGTPVALIVLGWLALTHPLAALGAVVVMAVPGWRRRRGTRPSPDDEAAFLLTLGTELAGGASLRTSLVSAADRAAGSLYLQPAARAAAAGLPAVTVAGLLGEALPRNGRIAAASWLLAADSGGPAAAVMQSLALRAARERGGSR